MPKKSVNSTYGSTFFLSQPPSRVATSPPRGRGAGDSVISLGDQKFQSAFFNTTYQRFNMPKNLDEARPAQYKNKSFISSVCLSGGATHGTGTPKFDPRTHSKTT
jgi:hypothetical protein